MAKRRFQLTEKQVNELLRVYANCKDGPTRTRYQAIRLYGTNYLTKEVLKIAGCSHSSLMDWCRQYRSDGVDGLIYGRVDGNRAKLKGEQLEELGMQLHLYTPAEVLGPLAVTPTGEFWTVPDLKRVVKQWYGVSYQSPSTYLRLFHPCKWDCCHLLRRRIF